MKKQRNGLISCILVMAFLVALIGTATATVGRQAVDVDYNNIKVVLDGESVNLVDANGNEVEPFAINGTTYLPVRAVSSALGLDVKWDGETNTVVLSSYVDKDMTLTFSFGERSGHYTGEVNEAGLPDGHGTFTTQNSEGTAWTYVGDWKNGHFEGFGTSTWASGQKHVGVYLNDEYCGPGTIYYEDGAKFSGEFSDRNNAIGMYADELGEHPAAIEDGSVVLIVTYTD